jgi:hypothetical protein
MQKVMLFYAVMAFSFFCNGQKYEVWLQTTDIQYLRVRNLEYSNDTVLSVYSNHFRFAPVRYENFKWDNIYAMGIRNKTAHNSRMITGFLVGFLATGLILYSNDNFMHTWDVGAPLMIGMLASAGGGAGVLIGHIMTPKIVIPLKGKNAKEKNQALQDFIHKNAIRNRDTR